MAIARIFSPLDKVLGICSLLDKGPGIYFPHIKEAGDLLLPYQGGLGGIPPMTP
jgi:hypothetical protein